MDFPRPSPDTGFGFHDSASSYWKPDDYPGYARMLREHGATWFLMWTFDEKKAAWARALKDAGIEVIVRLGPAYMPRPSIDMASVDAYIAAGVRWFVLGNEYNLFNEWSTEDNWKGFDKPLRHIADWYVRMADQIRAKGGWPMTPPPSLGGHHLHRDWFIRLMTALQNIAAEQGRSLESLLYPGGIGIHCRSVGNPLEDGPADYDCSAREWEWFDAKVNEFVGHSLPMANTEWGDEPNWSRRKNPNFDNRQKWDWWVNRNVEQIQWCNPAYSGYKYPDYIFANCFWILHSAPPWEDCSLIHNHPYLAEMGGSDITPLWDALPGLVTWNRLGDIPVPEPIPPQPEPPAPAPVVKLRVYDMDGQTKDYAWANAKYGIRVSPLAEEGWHLSQIREVSGPAGVECYVYGDGGQPAAGVEVGFYWPGGFQIKYSEVSGKAGFAYGPGSYITDPAVGGPHWIVVASETVCDSVSGLGMLAGTFHDHLDLVYQWGASEAQPEPPQPPEPPDPDIPDDDVPYTLVTGLGRRLAASTLLPMADLRPRIEAEYADLDAVGKRGLGPDDLWSITFHHTAYRGPLDIMGDDGIANLHTAIRGWPHIGYHFIVGKQGETYFCKKLAHYSPQSGYGRLNKYSIAVAVHGDFTKESPTTVQLEALRCIVESLEEFVGGGWGQCHPLPIIRHKDVAVTECPGNLYEKYRAHIDG